MPDRSCFSKPWEQLTLEENIRERIDHWTRQAKYHKSVGLTKEARGLEIAIADMKSVLRVERNG
jgi:hypothetical protein